MLSCDDSVAFTVFEVVGQPANLCALAPVGVPAVQEIADEAAAGIRHAHGAVGKRLYFKFPWRIVPDMPYFFKRKLAGKHHTLRAHFVKLRGGYAVYYTRLNGNMDFTVGRVLFDK